MNLQQWREKQQGEEFTLPSGLDVKLRRVSLLDLVQAGKIPQTLHAPVSEMLKRKADATLELKDLQEFGKVLDLIVEACLIGPKGLQISELPAADKQEIFNWANEAAGKLVPFRDQQITAVEPSLTVRDV